MHEWCVIISIMNFSVQYWNVLNMFCKSMLLAEGYQR